MNTKLSDVFVLPTVSTKRLGYNLEITRREGTPVFRYNEVRNIQLQSYEEAQLVSNAINQHDHLQAENKRLREELEKRIEFAYIEGFSGGKSDGELEQGNNAADEFKRSRAFESLNKLLKGAEK